jgi:hypothetical protein
MERNESAFFVKKKNHCIIRIGYTSTIKVRTTKAYYWPIMRRKDKRNRPFSTRETHLPGSNKRKERISPIIND